MKKKLTAQVDDLIEQGQAKKLIRISDDGKRIEYLRHGYHDNLVIATFRSPVF